MPDSPSEPSEYWIVEAHFEGDGWDFVECCSSESVAQKYIKQRRWGRQNKFRVRRFIPAEQP